jgi:predicted MarR family transcription regulator
MSGGVEIELELDPEWEKVRRWRVDCLTAAGVSDFTAFRLSLIPDLDLHRALELVEKGAPDEFLINEFID